jgi:hypothetical protein
MERFQHPAVGHLGMGLILLLSLCVVLPTVAFAGEKQYPVEGTVTALGTDKEPMGPNHQLFEYRTYTVKTLSRIFVLRCPNDMNAILAKRGCSGVGKKQIEIGDTIQLRIEKRNAYIQTAKGKEQRLEVLSESVKSD